MLKKPSERRFLLTALGLFLIVGVIDYLPALAGRVPLPAHLVTNFPAWHSTMPIPPAGTRNADYGDLVTFFYPWRILASRVVHQHELPQWNPHILGGTPLIASAPGGIFYPINALFYILPTPAAWSLKLILNVVLAGFLTALFVKSLGADAIGAMSAGVIYALCGFITGWQGQAISDAALWLPLICWSVHQIYKRPSPVSIAAGACAFGLPVLAGHPETAAHTTLVGLVFWGWQVLTGGWNRPSMLRRLGSFTVAALLAIGISAIQIFPTVEWLSEINHSLNIDWGGLMLKPHELLAFVSRDLSKTPNSSNIYIPEKTAYVGIAALVLAPFALFRIGSRRHALFFVLLIIFSIQVAASWEPGHWLASHTPVLNGVKNWRLLGVADFALAVLAGLGISHLRERRTPATVAVWILIGAVAAVLSYAIWALHARLISEVTWLHGPASAAALLVMALGIVSLRLLGRVDVRTFGTITLLFLCLDLLTYAAGYLPFVRTEEIFPPAPAITFLQQHDPRSNRVVNLKAYSVNAEIAYGLESVGGWEVSLKRVKDLLDDFSEPLLDEVRFDILKILRRRDRRLDLMNARYFVTNHYDKNYDLAAADPQRFVQVFTDSRVSVFENRRALPRAWFIPAAEDTIEIRPVRADQLRRLRDPSFDPERSVILSSLPAGVPREPPVHGATQGQITWRENRANSFTLNVSAAQSGVVVVSQISYQGWNAFVDGVRTSLLQPNYALIGAAVPAGTHEVRFEFRPLTVRIGAAVTVISLLVLLGIVVAGRAWVHSPSEFPADGPQTVIAAIVKGAARRPGIAAATTVAMIALIFGISVLKQSRQRIDPSHPPQLLLSTSEVRAGSDSYFLSIEDLPNATVSIQYSIDNEKPDSFLVTLDSDGAAIFEVGESTRKGTYRILGFRERNDEPWIPTNATIVVK